MTQRILGPIRVLQRAGPKKPYNQSELFPQGRKSRITYQPGTDTIYVTHLTSDIYSEINVGMNSIIMQNLEDVYRAIVILLLLFLLLL